MEIIKQFRCLKYVKYENKIGMCDHTGVYCTLDDNPENRQIVEETFEDQKQYMSSNYCHFCCGKYTCGYNITE